MKNVLIGLLICTLAAGLTLAQNISGPLSGSLGPGSYNVVDSIYVVNGASLVIQPGTTFNFGGAFSFRIMGYLNATGTETDSIKFIPAVGVPFWKGIKFADAAADSSRLEYCLIRGSNNMGLYLDHVNINVHHCTFTENSSVDYGGGVYNYYSGTTYSHCAFINNTALHGGAMCLRYTPSPALDNMIFTGNSGTYGGAIAIYFSAVTITNSLFYNNSGNQGGGIRFSSATNTVVTNCTFADNTAAAGWALFNINQIPTLTNLVVYDNFGDSTKAVHVHAGGFTVSYSCIQDSILWPGAGNINTNPLFVTGPFGDYYLSQVAAGQTANSPCLDAGDPASPMIIGTTRTDGVQDAGIVDMGYHYPLSQAAHPDVTVDLNPVNPPIQIPATGGTFEFLATITNHEAAAQPFTVWIMAQLPNGNWYGPALGPINLTLAAGAAIERYRTQSVPGGAPPGTYLYEGRVGVYPDEIWDTGSFNFVKLSTGDGTPISAWSNEGESFGPWNLGGDAVSPVDFALYGNYPNPFNPCTTISFDLPQPALVNLAVYDLQGRLVAKLIQGMRAAGRQEVTWNAVDQPSGLYFCRLQAGEFHAVAKMMLVK
jgi:hypothetical protein